MASTSWHGESFTSLLVEARAEQLANLSGRFVLSAAIGADLGCRSREIRSAAPGMSLQVESGHKTGQPARNLNPPAARWRHLTDTRSGIGTYI